VRRINIKEINWLGDTPFENAPDGGWELGVKVRSTRPPKPAYIHPTGAHTGEVELAIAEEGVAPGQACVFYDTTSTRVLGGGWITRN